MSEALLPVLMRYIHVLSAVGAVGAMLVMGICVLPALKMLEGSLKDGVVSVMEKRVHRLLLICIVGFLVSGIYNWVALASTYKAMGPIGNALIGTKVLLALIMFVVVGVRSFGLIRPKPARMINLHIAAVVILLATLLRHLRLEHLQAATGG